MCQSQDSTTCESQKCWQSFKHSRQWCVTYEKVNSISKIRKNLFAAFCVCVCVLISFVCLGAPPGVLRTNVPLTWTYPTNLLSTNLIFKVYSSTNVSVPVTNWPLTATVIGTNTNVVLPINAQQRFFVLTASNWWGESDFSNVAQTPPVPSDEGTLSIGP